MRCTGKYPCVNCTRMNVPCEYNAKYTRGQAPPIESASHNNEGELHSISFRDVTTVSRSPQYPALTGNSSEHKREEDEERGSDEEGMRIYDREEQMVR